MNEWSGDDLVVELAPFQSGLFQDKTGHYDIYIYIYIYIYILHFDYVPIYTFGFHRKQCASD